jgi:hypothetical protein
MRLPHLRVMTFPALAILAACATTQPLPPPEAACALRPPAGQSLYLEALAKEQPQAGRESFLYGNLQCLSVGTVAEVSGDF